MRPTINTEKHIVQYPIDEITMATVKGVNLIEVNEDRSINAAVRVGAKVTAIFVECWLMSNTQQLGNFIMILEKTVAGASGADANQMGNLNDYDNKKNIFYQTQGLVGDANSNPIPVVRQWFKIPKGKARFGNGDAYRIRIQAGVENINFCGFATFKEQY